MDLIRLLDNRLVAAAVWIADTVLTGLIVRKIPYTEIDWSAYMDQIRLIAEFDYADYNLIQGSTGPLVYPGGHVLIYRLLYNVTSKGADIGTAQNLFWGLYMVGLALVLAIYLRTRAPAYTFPYLMLSKRLHSIFVLRLFNDCFATVFASAAVLALVSTTNPRYARLKSVVSAALLSMAVSVKMSALLYLPGAAFVYLYTLRSVVACVLYVAVPMLLVQLAVLYPFAGHVKSYLDRAFEFDRVFLYQWTVNWRFVPEHIFLSKSFSVALLVLHLTLLVLFSRKWLAKFRTGLVELVTHPFKRVEVAPLDDGAYCNYVVTTLWTSNLIGVLCARSLHYQFYSWFYWTLPFLSREMTLIIWAAQEYAWNVFPSTEFSSAVLIASLGGLIMYKLLRTY